MITYYVSYAYTNSGVMFGLGSCMATFESEVPTFDELKDLEEHLIKDRGFKDVGLISFMKVKE